VDKVIPVDIYVPGCPSRPEAIIHAVAQLLELAEKRVRPVLESHATPEELVGITRVPPIAETELVEGTAAPREPRGSGRVSW
jgi:NADH:ubiquinone oxidoreductase subunit B-like Fe-S oxidoreductase